MSGFTRFPTLYLGYQVSLWLLCLHLIISEWSNVYLKYFAFRIKGNNAPQSFLQVNSQDPLPLSRSEGSWGELGQHRSSSLSLEMSWEREWAWNCQLCPEGPGVVSCSDGVSSRLTVCGSVGLDEPLQGWRKTCRCPGRWLALPLAS